MTFRKVQVLGFNWGKKLTLIMVCSLNKVLKEICVRKIPELWQNGFYVTFSVLCLFCISSWN